MNLEIGWVSSEFSVGHIGDVRSRLTDERMYGTSLSVEREAEWDFQRFVFHCLDDIRWWRRQLGLADALLAHVSKDTVRVVLDNLQVLHLSLPVDLENQLHVADRVEVTVLGDIVIPTGTHRLGHLLAVNAERRPHRVYAGLAAI